MPHTPGDWEFDEEEGAITAQGAPIATVSTSDDFACLPDEDHEAYDLMARANGRLMAASPTMLALLERFDALDTDPHVTDAEWSRFRRDVAALFAVVRGAP